ncbi:MAG: ferritin family protein [Bacteroidales bacterium]|jgi:rubrerythrin|nr:ferritin family protein [Bacteroidales bacterium]
MNKTLDILKQAILLERRGKAFYNQVAKQTDNPDVQNIFEIMAKEEVLHEKFLSDQYKAYEKDGKFANLELPNEDNDGIANMVLSKDMKKSIEAAGFEAAAISAAIDMETKAIKVYADQAQAATDSKEKALYEWLSDWEKTHHRILHELDEDLKQRVWNDNQFWPF